MKLLTGYHMPSRCQPAWRFRHSRRPGATDKRWHCSMLHGWSAQTASACRSSPRCFFPTSYGAGGHELCLEPPEWKAHEAVRVRLRGGLALVRGCLEPGKPVGHVPVTTGTGGRNWYGVRGTAEVPRPGAALPPRRSGLHSPSRGRKPPLSTNRSDSKSVSYHPRPRSIAFASSDALL